MNTMLATVEFSFDMLIEKSISEEGEWIIEGIASTESIDREDDIITRECIENALTDYMKMPVLRWRHQTTIGKVLAAEYRPQGLYVKARLSKTAEARDVWTLIRDGAARGLSVRGKAKADKVSRVKVKGQPARKIGGMEIYEISVVDVPANRESLITAVAKALELNIMSEEPEWAKDLKKSISNLAEVIGGITKAFEVSEEMLKLEDELQKELKDELEKVNETENAKPDASPEVIQKAVADEVQKILDEQPMRKAFREAEEIDKGKEKKPKKKAEDLVSKMYADEFTNIYNPDDGGDEWTVKKGE